EYLLFWSPHRRSISEVVVCILWRNKHLQCDIAKSLIGKSNTTERTLLGQTDHGKGVHIGGGQEIVLVHEQIISSLTTVRGVINCGGTFLVAGRRRNQFTGVTCGWL